MVFQRIARISLYERFILQRTEEGSILEAKREDMTGKARRTKTCQHGPYEEWPVQFVCSLGIFLYVAISSGSS